MDEEVHKYQGREPSGRQFGEIVLDSNSNDALLMIIVPYRHSIGKCFGVFFPYALEYKIYSLKLYNLLNVGIKSKPSAYNTGICSRFYTQMLYV